jgi:hypothetical protein
LLHRRCAKAHEPSRRRDRTRASSRPISPCHRRLEGVASLVEPVVGLDVTGRENPVCGRPEALIGRTAGDGPPALLSGRASDVPGRGMDAIAFSSMN